MPMIQMRGVKHLAHGHKDNNWQSQNSESLVADSNPCYSYYPLVAFQGEAYTVPVSFSILSSLSLYQCPFNHSQILLFDKRHKSKCEQTALDHHISLHNQSQPRACSYLDHFLA